MKKFFIGIAASLLFIACSSSQKKEQFTMNGNSELAGGLAINEPGLLYDGNTIVLTETEGASDTYIVPEIEQQKEDVVFRVKKIPTKLYLLNQGVKESEVDSVLQTLTGEQLFYIEFEEEEQQDLMKKYFTDNMDLSVNYLSAQIARDFSIRTEKGKRVSTNYCIYERNFHTAPFERLLLNFSGINADEAFVLTYHDRLFGKGKMKFSFPAKSYIKNINVPS